MASDPDGYGRPLRSAGERTAFPAHSERKRDQETRVAAGASAKWRKRAGPALRAERKKRQIMEGACPVFLDQGYSATSMDDVAASAGVSKGTLYKHFGSKDALFKAVVIAEAEGIARSLPRNLRGRTGDPTDVLETVRDETVMAFRSPAVQACLRLVMGAAMQVPELKGVFFLHAIEPALQSLATYLEIVDEPRSMSAREIRTEAERLILDYLGVALVDLLVRKASPDRASGTNRLSDRTEVYLDKTSSAPAGYGSNVREV